MIKAVVCVFIGYVFYLILEEMEDDDE